MKLIDTDTPPSTRVEHVGTGERGTFLGLNSFGHAEVQFDKDPEGQVDTVAIGEQRLFEVPV